MKEYGFKGRSRNDRCWYQFTGPGGKEVTMDLSAEEARRLIKEMTRVQRAAEEHEKADRIILDAAILQRAGANIGLSSHPKILNEAGKEAVHNRDLRRYMPGGVKSQEQFGMPTIINHGAHDDVH